jgi:smad nuclear-interacting protein 1
MYNGVVVKYSEPPEARKCPVRWRLYVFKKDDHIDTLYLHRQSAYLLGKDRRVSRDRMVMR